MSSASLPFRSNVPQHEADSDPLPPADPTVPGTLPLTTELISAFLASLTTYGIRLKFLSGTWESFHAKYTGFSYDVVLTSETIYRPDSLLSLVRLMREACVGQHIDATAVSRDSEKQSLEAATARLHLDDKVGSSPYLCLVAAKRVYFGVGGGVAEFIRAVEGLNGSEEGRGTHRSSVETVWEKTEGVKRIVMQVVW